MMVLAANVVKAGNELAGITETRTIPYVRNGTALNGMDCQGAL